MQVLRAKLIPEVLLNPSSGIDFVHVFFHAALYRRSVFQFKKRGFKKRG